MDRIAARIQQPIDAANQAAPAGEQRRREARPCPAAAALGGARQTGGIIARRAGSSDHPVVARHFALQIQLAADQERRRMNPDRRLDQGLQKSRPIVAPLHVPVLVQNDLIEIVRAEHPHQRRWNRDVWFVKSQYGRSGQTIAHHQPPVPPTRFGPERQLVFDRSWKRAAFVFQPIQKVNAGQDTQQTEERNRDPRTENQRQRPCWKRPHLDHDKLIGRGGESRRRQQRTGRHVRQRLPSEPDERRKRTPPDQAAGRRVHAR